jgi:hypothetical protein
MHTGEINFIAVVQLSGWIYNEDDTDKAVRARAFSRYEDATAWVSREVVLAHGVDAIVKSDDHGGAIISSPEGPVWGFVVSTVGISS